MDYLIALQPDLSISPADFARAWNEDPECRNVAEASEAASTARTFDPSFAVAMLAGVATGLVANTLYDLIKKALARKATHERIKITQLDQPDGSRLLFITIEKE